MADFSNSNRPSEGGLVLRGLSSEETRINDHPKIEIIRKYEIFVCSHSTLILFPHIVKFSTHIFDLVKVSLINSLRFYFIMFKFVRGERDRRELAWRRFLPVRQSKSDSKIRWVKKQGAWFRDRFVAARFNKTRFLRSEHGGGRQINVCPRYVGASSDARLQDFSKRS